MSFLTYLFCAIMVVLLSIGALYALSIATGSRYPSFLARLIASFFALILCACYGVFASICLRIVGYGGQSQWTVARAFKWSMWALTGVTFEVSDPEGALERRPCVMLANHQT